MTRDLIRAELLKLRTTRMFFWSVVATLAFVPVGIALAMTSAGQPGDAVLDSDEGVRNVMSSASSGALMLLVIGILMIAGEFRHGTVTSTFLVSPNRKRVVGAKLAAAGIVGVAVAVAAAVLTLAIAVPWLATRDVDVASRSADVALVLLGSLAATAIYALVGVGVGALLPNQTVAVIVALVWVTTVEGFVVAFQPEIGRWLPGGAASALTSVKTAEGGLLPMWAGGLLLAAYGVAFAAAGARLVLRRDIA
jgi:ABC-2 type transport system permease protein